MQERDHFSSLLHHAYYTILSAIVMQHLIRCYVLWKTLLVLCHGLTCALAWKYCKPSHGIWNNSLAAWFKVGLPIWWALGYVRMKECEKPLHVNLQADEKVTDYTCAPPPSLLPGVVQAWDLRCLCIYNMWVRGPMLDSINSITSEPALTSRACDLVGGWSNAIPYLIIIISPALTSFCELSGLLVPWCKRSLCTAKLRSGVTDAAFCMNVIIDLLHENMTIGVKLGRNDPQWSSAFTCLSIPVYVWTLLKE